MNKIYRVIWNVSKQTWTAVSELASGRIKSSICSDKKSNIFNRTFKLTALSALLFPPMVMADTYTVVGGTVNNSNGGTAMAIGTGSEVAENAGHYGSYSSAIGANAVANGDASTAIGSGANSSSAATAVGVQAIAGERGTALGLYANANSSQAVAIGHNTTSTGSSSVAIGTSSSATGPAAIVLGAGSTATNQRTIAIGEVATATGWYATAIGRGATANGTNSIALGSSANQTSGDAPIASANYTVAIGTGAKAIQVSTVALGYNTTASGRNAIAIGHSSNATGNYTVAMGLNSNASGNNSVAIGNEANAAVSSIAVGPSAAATGTNAVAMGTASNASAESTIAIGNGANAAGVNSISIGTGNNVSGNASGAIGDPTTITGNGTYTIGNNNGVVSANEAGAFGNNNTLTGDYSRIIGNNNTVSTENTFVVGNNVSATQENSVVLGNASTDRAATSETQATVNGTTYTGFAGNAPVGVVSVGSEGGERQIINVAAGNVSATSTDAINGSQLYAVANEINSSVAASAVHFYSSNGGDSTSGNYNNDGATGTSSLAAGVNATAAGDNAIAVGTNATATYIDTMAIGTNANPTGDRGVSIGTNSTAHEDSVALGTNTNASGRSAVAIGNNANASMLYSVAIGENATTTTAQAATAVGQGSTVTAENGSAFGNGANATARYGVGLGYYANASNNMSVALGSESTTAEAVATTNATVNGISYDGFAGTEPVATVSVGGTAVPTERTETGQPVGTDTYELTRTITNVAAGRVDANSTDAINGSQLYAVTGVIGNLANSAVTILGGNATLNSNGTITMSNIGNTGENTVHDAINSVRQAANNATTAATQPLTFAGDTGTNVSRQLGTTVNVVGGQTDATKLTDNNIGVVADGTDTLTVKLAENIDLGSNGSVTTGNTTVSNSGVTVGNNVTLTDSGLTAGNVSVTTSGINAGDNKITGVAAGDITATSTDAVNGSQLYAVQQQMNTSVQAAKTEVTGSDGTVTVTSTTGSNGQSIYNLGVNTTNLTTNANGTVAVPTSTNSFATARDVANAINNSGWSLNSTATGTGQVTGDTSAALVRAGSSVNLNAGNNIVINRSGTNVTVATSMTPTFTSVTATDRIGITNGPSMSTSGIDAANQRITNVADGVDDTDAVNVRQLREATNNANNNNTAIKNLDGKINRVNKELRAGIAGAVATAGLPQAYMPGKSMMAASAGTYKNEGALAVGYSRASDSGKVVVKLTGSANTRGDYTGSVGMGYQW